jgi:small conductance mechanosensitive channel
VVAVLARFGIQTASILALIGAAGLAIGLALQGALSNVASGVMLFYLRPFGIGDYVDADGTAGSVVEIGLFATEPVTA